MRKATSEALRRLAEEDGIPISEAIIYCAIGVLALVALAVVLACAVVAILS